MSEERFWLSMWGIVAVILITAIHTAAYYSNISYQRDHEEVMEALKTHQTAFLIHRAALENVRR
jgi:hypothetical protein